MKATKGPWKSEVNENKKGEVAVEIWNHNTKVATVNTNSVFKNEFVQGNACLMAAAPELLIVCKNTLTQLKQLVELTPDQIGLVDQIEQSLKYVIAKAEGSDVIGRGSEK